MSRYSFTVEDSSGNIVAALQNVIAPRYNRTKNSADQMSLELPRGDVDFSHLKVGRRIEIQRSGQYEASGYITDRGYSEDTVQVEAQTEEIVLQRYLTPAQFGYPLAAEYPTLDAFTDNIRKLYTPLRLKHKDQYATHLLSSTNIDFDANPEIVYLTQTGGDYAASGNFVLRFRSTDFDDWQSWDRVRWLADYADNVKVTLQTRSGVDDAAASADSWTAEVPGALTDVVGFIPPRTGDQVLDVRFNLTTTDTSLSANVFAVEVIAREPSGILLGTIDAGAADISVPNIEADSANLLDVMVDVFNQVEWEFRIRNNQIDVAESFGTDRTNEFTLIAG